MPKYTFLHNLDLQKKFKPNALSINIAMMHDITALYEIDILNLIQITFDWTRSWDAKPRYEISSEFSSRSYPKSWSLFNVDNKWNRENIQKGVEFLSNHLDYLPEFIVDATFTIMGECLGYKVHDKRFILPESDAEYKELLELGKCHLAVLMIFIEELGKIGIDCRALRINTKPFFVGGCVSDCLEGENYLSELRKIFKIQEYWLNGKNYPTKGKNDIVEKSFQFDTDKIYRQLKFNDLEEFFNMLLEIINRLCTFSSEMIDPDALDFTKYYYPNDALPNSYNLPQGKLIDAKKCLINFLEKLKKGTFINSYYQAKGNIDFEVSDNTNLKSSVSSNAISTERKTTVDPQILREFISYLLAKNYIYATSNNTLAVNEDLDTNPEALTHDFVIENPKYYPENHADQFYYMVYYIDMYLDMIRKQAKTISIPIPSNGRQYASNDNNEEIIQALIKRIQALESRQDTLEKKMDNLSDDVASLKELILNYLETGQNKPDFSTMDMDVISEILKNAQVKTVGAKIRKKLLLMAIALGMVSLLKSSSANIGGYKTPDLNETKHPAVEITTSPNREYPENIIIPSKPNTIETISPIKEKIVMSILEEISGERNYYVSIYDQERTGMTKQTGYIIHYFAFNNGELVASLGKETELKDFITNNNAQDFTWKVAVSCVDFNTLKNYIDSGMEVPLEYTTFFTDYIPEYRAMRMRENK